MGDEDSGWLRRRGQGGGGVKSNKAAQSRPEGNATIDTVSSTPLTNRILLNTN